MTGSRRRILKASQDQERSQNIQTTLHSQSRASKERFSDTVQCQPLICLSESQSEKKKKNSITDAQTDLE